MSDEVPGETERLEGLLFVEAFLHAVLAEVPLTGGGRRTDVIRGKRF
jgi:hypothetical protein